MVAGLGSSRVRSVIAPAVAPYTRLFLDDLLWVREPIFVEKDQPRDGGLLRLRFGGDRYWHAVAWPRGLPRPKAGHHPADAMPVECSRYTLRVATVQRRRLLQISADEAWACGVSGEEGAFVSPIAEIDLFKPFPTPGEALGHAWTEAGFGAAWADPDVLLVEFTALARNVGRLVDGMGSGVRRA
ncbi:hypothetical protein [Paracoccus litorisediminis]|uniref:Uncharacterized protein n=1 Tax=Paracoccus litorisediminis TaxID=2006130 RepID=A0A844HST0_9RHOB|nr:hypothetical protein [Paracoccus litorisediminis]MTH62148.1 hypothetical protein [Paracoccus litorisediminis]